jgi:hypothetical protein
VLVKTLPSTVTNLVLLALDKAEHQIADVEGAALDLTADVVGIV